MEVQCLSRKTNTEKFSPFYRQLLVCLVSSSFFFMSGLNLGTPTVAVPQLRKEANSTNAVSEEMASWLTSIVGYMGMLGIVLLTTSAHIIGRKKTWLVSACSNGVGFILLYNSTNVIYLFCSQLLSGLVIGTQISVSIMVITECSSPKYRGIFLTLKPCSAVWGLWCANVIGTFFNFRYIALIGIMCCVFNVCVTSIIPESPYWLAFKGLYAECATAHRWLKGVDDDAEKELDLLIHSQNNNKKKVEKKFSIIAITKKYISIILGPEYYKPAVLCILSSTIHYFSGKIAFAVYAIEMMKKITNNNESMAYAAMLILDGFSVLGMYICVYLARILKRKTQLLIFYSIGTVLVFIISFYLFLVKHKILQENNYVSISLLSVYSLAICCGPLMMGSTICGELYPLKNRSFFICVNGVLSKFFMGSVLKLTPYLFRTFDCHGTFLFFGVIAVVQILLTYHFLPETKDRTLQEISELFKIGNSKPSDTDTEIKLLQNKEIP